MSIIEVAKNKDEILKKWAGHARFCPFCQHNYYSPFDKLYMEAYGICYQCDKSSEDELERRSNNIFEIL